MPLTEAEVSSLRSDQATQIGRLSTGRFDEYLAPSALNTADRLAFRQKILARWSNLSADRLRARVNIIGISYGDTTVVNYAPENNYTTAEMQTIADTYREGKGLADIARIVGAGLSVEQRLAAGGL